jgi:predicted naringenin-chalcone synthase
VTTAYLNRIATRVPDHEVHDTFVRFARTLLREHRGLRLFERMVDRAHITERYSVLEPASEPENGSVDAKGLYRRTRFPSTAERMKVFEAEAPRLAERAVSALDLGPDVRRVTHLLVTSCTGMYAPGIDWDIMVRCGLPSTVERTSVGFMGCFAAINGLKLARHIVRSNPDARVLLVNVELCTLHLKETTDIDQMLSFLVFGDGCAASLVSADPVGISLDRFHAAVVPETSDLITWKVRDTGFDMFLSGQVPSSIREGLGAASPAILAGQRPETIEHWAIHPGGRSVLDAVEQGIGLGGAALGASRNVLRRFGNMSSATVMFVLQAILESARAGERGCAMSFGPGLTAETFLFQKV